MSTTIVRPARRVTAKLFYFITVVCAVFGGYFLATNITGNAWAFCLFGALLSLIIGITFAHPGASQQKPLPADVAITDLPTGQVRGLRTDVIQVQQPAHRTR